MAADRAPDHPPGEDEAVPGSRGTVLIASRDLRGSERLGAALERRLFGVVGARDAAALAATLEARPVDVVLLDLDLPDTDAIALCEELGEQHDDLPVVIVAPTGTLDTALRSMRAGAYDYLARPLKVEAVAIALDRAVEHRRLRTEVRRLRRAVASSHGFEELIGDSPPMRELYDLLGRVADTEVPVLITGETGTGKEVVARAIHRRSSRKSKAFVPINCAAIPDALLEAELFGHVKGAFTDARAGRPGLFVEATGGTLFLDEIGDMPLSLQPKLLRALQERKVRPVGSDKEVPVDVRVVAATNRDLESAVEQGRFRQDLYFRIDVIQVDIPALRSRGADILVLAQHFIDIAAARSSKRVERLCDAAARRLLEYLWPGNVRELENCIERAVALTRTEEIQVEDFPARIRSYQRSHVLVAADDPTELVTMDVVEERYIRRVLAAVQGNKSTASRILGLDRKTLYRKLERYGIAGEREAGDPMLGEPSDG